MQTRRRFIFAVWMVGLAMSFSAVHVWAQAVENAQIHGTVRDNTGAVIAGAHVRAMLTDTGHAQSTIADAAGEYVLPGLPVGAYELQVSAPSFGTYTRSGITLQVGNNVRIDVALNVGSTSTEVQVSADANMVETQDTSISEVIDRRRIVDLPLNGRQATDLIVLSGGAAVPPNSSRYITTHDYPTSVAVSVSGGQANGNNYLLDGADHNDAQSNVNLPFPFPDALQEFSVQTSGISSRFGLHPGSVVNVVTRGGTNKVHGNVFEFLRNGDLNARNYFATSRDNLKRNQFGGTVGGPLIRNKLQGFFGFQETIQRTSPPSTVAFVPTQAARNGDFSVMESAACQSNHTTKQLVNPATHAPYPGNYIDPKTFSAPAVNLLSEIPVPTDPCGKLIYSIPNPSNEYQYVGRADYAINDKHSAFMRYFITEYVNPPFFEKGNILTTTRPGFDEQVNAVAFGDQYSFTPNLINSAHIGYTRLAVYRSVPSGIPSPTDLGVNMYAPVQGFLYLTVTNDFAVEGGSNAPGKIIRNQYQVADDVDWVHGLHHVSFGGEVITNQFYEVSAVYENGFFTFNGSLSNDANADFLLGRQSQMLVSSLSILDSRQKYFGAYAQDDITPSKQFTFHVGMRYEPNLPEYEATGEGNYFDKGNFLAGVRSKAYNNSPPGLMFVGDPGINRSYTHGSYLGFAPRIGFVWDPTGAGKMSVRSSYGIFFDTPELGTNQDFSLSAPWGNEITLTAPGGGFANPWAGYAGGDPFPFPYPPTANAPFPQQGAYVYLPFNIHHTYMQQYDLSLQRQLGTDWLISADYVGNRGVHLRGTTETNPAIYIPGSSTTSNTAARRTLTQLNPTYGPYYSTLTTLDDGVSTNYNALRLTAKHRFANHYTFLAVYTYSKCLQDTETLGNKLDGNSESNPYNRMADYGPCDFDLRHNFVASFVYEPITFKNRVVNLIAGNWEVGALASVNSGFPINVLTGVDASLTGVGQDRPNFLPGVAHYVRNTQTHQWINPAAYIKNPPGTFGTVSMNSLTSPGYVDTDVNLTRMIPVRESQRLELRFEAFNLFNHTNYSAPVNNFSSGSFGVIQAANSPRILQLSAKYVF
jgi:hypothetical protein